MDEYRGVLVDSGEGLDHSRGLLVESGGPLGDSRVYVDEYGGRLIDTGEGLDDSRGRIDEYRGAWVGSRGLVVNSRASGDGPCVDVVPSRSRELDEGQRFTHGREHRPGKRMRRRAGPDTRRRMDYC